MIPQSILDQVQDRCDIVEVISRYIPLKRLGKNFKCPCPFHHEKTPSFVVSSEKQIFHCFGCGVGGNVFSFLMKYEKLNFRDAVKQLAESVGVVIPEDEAAQKKRDYLKPLYQANELALQFYTKFLAQTSKSSQIWRYIQSRKISQEAIERFRIGYSPNNWDSFLKAAKNHLAPQTLEKAGLLLRRESGGHYDRFRNRMMFPITNVKGNVVGFGARVLDKSLPKYVNSPETEIYHKGRTLYGLYESKEAIRSENRVYIVEGYTDVMTCFQAGVHNVVASSGTALTTDQIKLLKRYTNHVVVLFDSDPAGLAASLRGMDLLIEEGCEVFIATMPEGHDPDTYVNEFGAEKFRSDVLAKVEELFEFKYNFLCRANNRMTNSGKTKIAMEMLSTLRRIPNEVTKTTMVEALSERLAIPSQALRVELSKIKKGQSQPGKQAVFIKNNISRKPKANDLPSEKSTLLERLLIGLMLKKDKFWSIAKDKLRIDDFSTTHVKGLVKKIFAQESFGYLSIGRVLNFFQEDEEISLLVRQSVNEVDEIQDEERAFDDCLQKVIEIRRKKRIDQMQLQIAQCESVNDREGVNKLLQEISEYSKKGK